MQLWCKEGIPSSARERCSSCLHLDFPNVTEVEIIIPMWDCCFLFKLRSSCLKPCSLFPGSDLLFGHIWMHCLDVVAIARDAEVVPLGLLVSAFLEKVTLPMRSQLKNRLEVVIPVVRVVQLLFGKNKCYPFPLCTPNYFFLIIWENNCELQNCWKTIFLTLPLADEFTY